MAPHIQQAHRQAETPPLQGTLTIPGEGKAVMFGRGDGPDGARVTGEDAVAQQLMTGIVSAV